MIQASRTRQAAPSKSSARPVGLARVETKTAWHARQIGTPPRLVAQLVTTAFKAGPLTGAREAFVARAVLPGREPTHRVVVVAWTARLVFIVEARTMCWCARRVLLDGKTRLKPARRVVLFLRVSSKTAPSAQNCVLRVSIAREETPRKYLVLLGRTPSSKAQCLAFPAARGNSVLRILLGLRAASSAPRGGTRTIL